MPKYRVDLDAKAYISFSLKVEAAGEEQAETLALAQAKTVLSYVQPGPNEVRAIARKTKTEITDDTINFGDDDDGTDVNGIEELS